MSLIAAKSKTGINSNNLKGSTCVIIGSYPVFRIMCWDRSVYRMFFHLGIRLTLASVGDVIRSLGLRGRDQTRLEADIILTSASSILYRSSKDLLTIVT